MRTHTIPGGAYVDALPDGCYAAISGPGVETQAGYLPAVGDALPLGLRVSWDGLRFGGQGSNFHGWLEWNGAWVRHETPADASPTRLGVIYAQGESEPRVWIGGPNRDNDGFRFVAPNGRSVMCDETRWDGQLSEWIDLGDGIRIGQGNPGGGVMVRIDGVLRWLHQGECFGINAKRDGEQCAVAFVHKGVGSVIYWPTDADLRALPVVDLAPEPTPDPKPTPEPEPTPMYEPIPSRLSVVEEVWNRCTPEQRARHAFVAEAVAFELRRRGLDFYVNQKRGHQGDSEDAISTPHPHGAGGWAIIDIVAEMNTPRARPAWIDVTQATIDAETVGGGRLPTNVLGVGGDDGDDGDTGSGDPVRPELADVLQHITDAASAAMRAQKALAAVEWPAPQQPQECPPCELPHDGVELPPYADALALGDAIDEAIAGRRDRLGAQAFAHLMHRFYSRSHTREQIVDEARLRARGEWRDQW